MHKLTGYGLLRTENGALVLVIDQFTKGLLPAILEDISANTDFDTVIVDLFKFPFHSDSAETLIAGIEEVCRLLQAQTRPGLHLKFCVTNEVKQKCAALQPNFFAGSSDQYAATLMKDELFAENGFDITHVPMCVIT